MINFELSPALENLRNMVRMVAENNIRPIARKHDDHDAGKPWDYINFMWETVKSRAAEEATPKEKKKSGHPREDSLQLCIIIEELAQHGEIVLPRNTDFVFVLRNRKDVRACYLIGQSCERLN